LLKLGQALQISIADLVDLFEPSPNIEAASETADHIQPAQEAEHSVQQHQQALTDLQQEYARLQEILAQQRAALWQEFQQSSLQTLESLLLQLPTAAHAAQQNPQVPAVKLLPLLRPFDDLLQAWGVEAIAQVGTEIPYDPQQHQLMEGTAQVGDRVRVRYTGYRQNEKLLYRAKVSPAITTK
jgi:molecular chaperone GrpE (heat shock protein)